MGIVPEGHTPGQVEADHGSTTAFRPSWARYTSMEVVAAVSRQLGTGALLAKLDIKAAYLLVPVHPNDHRLWGLSGTAGTMLTSAQLLRSSQQWLMFYSER